MSSSLSQWWLTATVIALLHLPLAAQIFLDADTPATGGDLLVMPLVTTFGTITFTGELFGPPPSDAEFIAAGAAGRVFDTIGTPTTATFTFTFDVTDFTFIYGGNAGSITITARDSMGATVDSFFQADTGAGLPAGPETLSGTGIRSVTWVDSGGNYCALDNITIEAGPGCTITPPPGTAIGDVLLSLSTTSPVSMLVDLAFDFSLDGGTTWAPCTAAASSVLPNPATGVSTGMTSFTWNSVADGVGLLAVATGVLVRATVDDGVSPVPGSCTTAPFDVDNVPPPPTCTLTAPPTGGGNISVDLDATSPNAPAVDVLIEHSEDGGATFQPCTAAAGSPLANPATAVPTGLSSFLWDFRADGVGVVVVAPAVLLRATLDDLVAPMTGECLTAAFDVDNTSICGGLCGDCSLNGVGPNILDALTGAQIAAGLVAPTLEQTGCCDVNSSMSIDIIDALIMAQAAAGLPVALSCP